MKCFQCKKEIYGKEIVTVPDGDTFHEECYDTFIKERNEFFNEIIIDDERYDNWINDE